MTALHPRLDVHRVDPNAQQAVAGMERYVRGSGLDPRLYELVKIRASQLNGCAFCLDMHNRDARAAGEDQRRLDVLSAWREAPALFTGLRAGGAGAHRSGHPHRRRRCPRSGLGRRRRALR